MQPKDLPLIDYQIASAAEAIHGLRAAAEDHSPDAIVPATASSFLNLADLIADMRATLIAAQHDTLASTEALRRIAEMRVREVFRLADAGDWRMLATELQEIAFEAVAASENGAASGAPVRRARRALPAMASFDRAANAPAPVEAANENPAQSRSAG